MACGRSRRLRWEDQGGEVFGVERIRTGWRGPARDSRLRCCSCRDFTYADDDWGNLRDGDTVLLSFQRAADYQAPDWQLHIDVTVDDVDQAARQVLALGARRTDLQGLAPNRPFSSL
jgi:hypothetical protein